MNDFLTGREADSAGSLPQAGVWGLLFRSPILICLGQLAPGKEGPSRSVGRATVHLWRFFYPGAFLSLSTAGHGGSSRTHQASLLLLLSFPSPPPPHGAPLQRPAVSSFQLQCPPHSLAALSSLVSAGVGRGEDGCSPKAPLPSRPLQPGGSWGDRRKADELSGSQRDRVRRDSAFTTHAPALGSFLPREFPDRLCHLPEVQETIPVRSPVFLASVGGFSSLPQSLGRRCVSLSLGK